MKLSDLVVSQKIKLLLVGASGAGKTVFACSGPGRTYVFDFDNKLSSAASYYQHKNPEQMRNIEYDQFTLNKTNAKPYLDFKAKLDVLEKMASVGKFEFDTVVLDSTTLYSEALMAHVISTNPGVKRAFSNVPALQDYLVSGTFFKEDMNRLLSLPCNVICTAHSSVVIDPTTDKARNTILLTGKIAEHLPRIFTEVFWAFVKQEAPKSPTEEGVIKHVALTRSNGAYTCRTQLPKIPLWIPLDFNYILGHVNKKENKQ